MGIHVVVVVIAVNGEVRNDSLHRMRLKPTLLQGREECRFDVFVDVVVVVSDEMFRLIVAGKWRNSVFSPVLY